MRKSQAKRRVMRIVTAFVLCATGALGKVSSDTERGLPQYTTESSNKKYLFVMLKGGDPDSIEIARSEKYVASGLYLNDGSATPLWTVDWAGLVIVPSDGLHLIRKGRWPRESDGYGAEALTFFENGHPLKTYEVRDLVAIPWLLPHTSSHYRWQRTIPETEGAVTTIVRPLYGGAYEQNEGVVLDENSQTLKVATLQGDAYIFDITTGQILSSSRPFRTALICFFAVFALLYGAFLYRGVSRTVPPFRRSATRIAKGLLFLIPSVFMVLVIVYELTSRYGANTFVMSLWRAFVYLPVYLSERVGLRITIDELASVAFATFFWSLVLVILAIVSNRLIWLITGVLGVRNKRAN